MTHASIMRLMCCVVMVAAVIGGVMELSLGRSVWPATACVWIGLCYLRITDDDRG